jgi:toxin CcdB
MAQFDIYRQNGRSILLVDCQSNHLSHLTTRFVVPLIPTGNSPPTATGLNPVLEFDNEHFVLSPNASATIRVRDMGTRIGSLVAEQDVIKTAIDQLVTGF